MVEELPGLAGDWKKNKYEPDVLNRSFTGGLGQQVRQTSHPGIGITATVEEFPNVSRTVYTSREQKPSANNRSEMAMLRLLRAGDQIEYSEKGGGRIVVVPKGNVISIETWREKTSQYFGIVELAYNPEGIFLARFKAESVYTSLGEEEKPWQEEIGRLLNMLELTDNSVTVEVAEEELEEYKERFGEKSEIFNQISVSADKAFDKVINFFPLDDRDRYRKKLEEIHFRDGIIGQMFYFLTEKEYSLDQLQNKLDVVLDWSINFFISLLTYESNEIASPVFGIEDFGENSFRWREESSEFGSLSRGEDNRNSYGEEIPVQENRFRVEKRGEKIKVTCSKNDGSKRWEVLFPKKVEVEKVKKLFKPEEDFRRAKSVVGIRLKFFA